MPLNDSIFRDFIEVLESASHNEVACGNFLTHAANYLVRVTALNVETVIREDRSHYGNSDFIIIYNAKSPVGRIEKYAIIWEIKAPQCYIMERDDNNNRCRPTIDFIKAENQLIHYHLEIASNEDFRRRHRITSRNHIKIGGIIIGRDSTIIDESRYPNMRSVAENSYEVRMLQIYEKSGFVIYTWDRIAEYLKPDQY